MSQFVLVERGVSTESFPGLALTTPSPKDEFAKAVASHYFSQPDRCRFVTDEMLDGEPLVDEVFTVQQGGGDIEATTFLRFLHSLVDARIEFVCWHGGDYLDLPRVVTWAQIIDQVREQTRSQPADLFLHFTG